MINIARIACVIKILNQIVNCGTIQMVKLVHGLNKIENFAKIMELNLKILVKMQKKVVVYVKILLKKFISLNLKALIINQIKIYQIYA